jgi:hypothetical protein
MLLCRHKGGVEKSTVAFRSLCIRLMRSRDPQLFSLPGIVDCNSRAAKKKNYRIVGIHAHYSHRLESWINILLSVVENPDRQLTLLRRSAGLPFAITGNN